MAALEAAGANGDVAPPLDESVSPVAGRRFTRA
jgi:hypothetical protein